MAPPMAGVTVCASLPFRGSMSMQHRMPQPALMLSAFRIYSLLYPFRPKSYCHLTCLLARNNQTFPQPRMSRSFIFCGNVRFQLRPPSSNEMYDANTRYQSFQSKQTEIKRKKNAFLLGLLLCYNRVLSSVISLHAICDSRNRRNQKLCEVLAKNERTSREDVFLSRSILIVKATCLIIQQKRGLN